MSGFFGMNTTDIRDIEASQTLYWTIAIPVTVAVLAFAFVYGYRGDEIGDWIHDRVRLARGARRQAPATKWDAATVPADEAGDGRTRWTMDGKGAKGVWKAVQQHSARHRARRRDAEVMRRSTFQSDVL